MIFLFAQDNVKVNFNRNIKIDFFEILRYYLEHYISYWFFTIQSLNL
jgi:hypothetical protein